MTESAAAANISQSSMLATISTEMARAMKRHYGAGPVSAKSYLVDDLLFVALRGGITRAERTMLDAGRENIVREFRQQFDNEMAQPLIELIERLTGRGVVNYQGQVVFDPAMSIKIFVFGDRLGQDGVPGQAATAPLRLIDRSQDDGREEGGGGR